MRLDLLHLLRMLRRSPASAAAAVVTLSLTLGAGASIFAVVDAILLTPPPFADPGALVMAGEAPRDDPRAAGRGVTYATFERWRARAGSLAALEAMDGTNLTLTGVGAAERLSVSDVTPGFLTLLGVTPAIGRGFDAGDLERPVVIVSHGFWRGKLAGDPNVIGRQIVLGALPYTIVGVLAEHFYFALDPCDIWRPFQISAAQASRTGFRVGVVARLARGVSPADFQAAVDEVSRMASRPARADVRGVATEIAGDATKTLGMLAGAAALAVLIAFTNLAGLLILRSIDRRRELAVRSALGARRSEIARQLLLEAEALVAIGTAGGVLLAIWLTPAVGRLALEVFGGIANREIAVSWRVIAAMSLVAAACAGICAVVPATLVSRRNVVAVLRRGATPAPHELTLRRLFVTGEIALAFVLLVSVAHLGQSLYSVLTTRPGFDPQGVLALAVSLPSRSYPGPERVAAFYSELQQTLDARLGTGATAIVDEIPLSGNRTPSPVGLRPGDQGNAAVVRAAGRGYFDVMRIPILSGRSFEAGDNATAPARVVVSQSLAAKLFPQEQAVGRRIWLAATAQMADVIGVVGDVKHRALDEAGLSTVYLSAVQAPSNSNLVVVRSAHPDNDVIAAVREGVARLDRDLPVYGVKSMADVIARSPGVPARRVLTAAFAGFALLAVVLGAIGLFGVVAHDVASRRGELALRIALGANPGRILSATFGQGALMLGIGLAAGGLLSIWATGALSSVVVTASRSDLLSTGAATAVLVLAGTAAVLPAARRAARTDPLIALRSE